MAKKFKISYVDYGIANRFPNKEITINKKLLEREYKPLHDEILEHEKKHTDSGYSKKDLDLDFIGFKNKGLYRKFILTTPSSWLQFLPFYKYNDSWFFDLLFLILWLAFLLSLMLYLLI